MHLSCPERLCCHALLHTACAADWWCANCSRFQTAHQLGVPTIVRGLRRACDWDPACLVRACHNTFHGEKQANNPDKILDVWPPARHLNLNLHLHFCTARVQSKQGWKVSG